MGNVGLGSWWFKMVAGVLVVQMGMEEIWDRAG